MRLITVCSPSHLPLLGEVFLPSYVRFPEGFESLEVFSMPQFCPSGAWGSPRWGEAMAFKVASILDALRRVSSAGALVYSDADVQWFGPVGGWIASQSPEMQIVCQDDGGKPCAGFMRLRPTRQVFKTLGDVLARLRHRESFSDQHFLLPALNAGGIKPGLFDRQVIWAALGGCWKQGDPAPAAPATMRLHHGNWNIGLADKIALMRHVREHRGGAY